MKANFQITYFLWLARRNKAGNAPIYLRSKQNSLKQHSYFTGVKLSKEQWNKSRNKPKVMPVQLVELETKLQSTYSDLRTQGHEPDLPMLLQHLNEGRKPTDNTVIAWCDDYMAAAYNPGQKKAVATVRTNVEAFNRSLTFDSLTKPRLKSFFEWLTKNNVANNSQYKRLRALINVASHANIDCPHLKSYEMPYSTVNALKVRLDWMEVKSVMDTEPKNKMEQVAKDVFLLACFSGLRIGDILTLPDGELNKFHYEKMQEKTKLPVLVTIHKYNQLLFEKFIGDGVRYSRQTLSMSLKPLLERSGLTKNVKRVQAVGSGYKESTKPKWKEIAFHSGRRFYARLLNDLGLGNEIARDELGHSFRSVTELYAGSSEHSFRVARVRKAMEQLETKMEELALMMVA